MAHIPSVVDRLLQRDSIGGAAGLAVGSPAWFAWLLDDAVRSFSFRSPAGGYTARKEHRQRGGVYWVAYRTAAGQQHKVYLGKADDLTLERLDEAAAVLAAHVADAAAPAGQTGSARGGRPGRMSPSTAASPCWRPRSSRLNPIDLVPRPHLLAPRCRCGCGSCFAAVGSGRGRQDQLLAAWLAQLDRPVAWLTLDARDQDFGHVLRYLIAALHTIAPACGREALAWLDAPRPPPPEVVVTALVNDLAALPAPGLLVLDDYHLVSAPDIHARTFLLDTAASLQPVIPSVGPAPPFPGFLPATATD